MKNKIIKINFAIFILLILLSFVSGANIGISPAKIKFEDVLRGGYAEKVVAVTIDSEEPMKVEVEKRGEIEEWISFEETNFEVSKSNPYYITIYAQPPEDTPNGIYQGFVRVKISGNSNLVEGRATGIVNAALDLNVEVEVTDVESLSCSAGQFSVESTEIGEPIIFSANIVNSGNIKLKPSFRVEIWDENQIEMVKQENFIGQEISPTTSDKVIFEVDSKGMGLGQYWVDFYAVDCYNSQTLTFDILEIGALRASGVLINIITEPWVEVGDTTSMQAIFGNNGEKSIRAQFRGQITQNGRIVQILESPEFLVGIGENREFNFYFTPQEVGKYIVSGRVFYDGKRTFEQSSIINVIDTGFKISKIIKPLIYIILIFGIGFLLYKINQEKKLMEGKKYKKRK